MTHFLLDRYCALDHYRPSDLQHTILSFFIVMLILKRFTKPRTYLQVWVLTGDKVETAVNIAYSCGHFKRFMTILTLTGLKDCQDAHTRLDTCLYVPQSL